MTGFKGWRITRNGIIAVIVLAVLTVVVTLGIVSVMQRGETARREEALQIALENLEDEAAGPGVIAVAPPRETNVGQESTASPIPPTLPQTGLDAWSLLPVILLTYSIALYLTSARTAAKTRLSSVFRVK